MRLHSLPGGGQMALPMGTLGLACMAGTLAGLWWPGPPPPWACVLALAAALPVLGWPRQGWVLAVALLGFGNAGLQMRQALRAQLPVAVEGQVLALEGTVEGLPQPAPSGTRFTLVVDDSPRVPGYLRGRRLQVAWYALRGTPAGRALPMLRPGARWRLWLRLRAPRGLINPGGVDSERLALAERVAARAVVVRPQAARALSPGDGVDAWRQTMSARIEAVLPADEARFIQALALGDTHALTDADWDLLRRGGLTHLIAISGSHVGVVGSFVALLVAGLWWLWPPLGRWLPRRQAAAMAAALGSGGYSLVAGMSLPTLRTVLMIAVAVLHVLARRRSHVPHTLAVVLLVVLAWDPLSALHAGFWLSFGGVAWLVACMPAGPQPPLRGFLAAQRVATLGLVPLTLALFGQVSLLGPLANLLAIPCWSLGVVPLALAGTGLEALAAGAGQWAWNLAGWGFGLSWRMFQWLGQWPQASWVAPESGALALLLALAGAFWMLMPSPLPGRWLAPLLWLPMCLPARPALGSGEAEVAVLDVGQGLAVVVRTAGHVLLYDTGPRVPGGFDAGERVVVPALRALGIGRIDRLVLSHADADHAGGYPAVRAALPIADALAPAGAPLAVAHRCVAGQGWQWDGVGFRFLHPPAGFPYLGNDSGCVLQVRTRAGALLLPADIGRIIEQRLVRERPGWLQAQVVVVPHHGSAGSSSPAFVEAVQARVAVVSSGHGNRFGHPRAEVVRRWRAAGARVLDTADSGLVDLWMRAGGVEVVPRRRRLSRSWDAADRWRVAAILSANEHTAAVPED